MPFNRFFQQAKKKTSGQALVEFAVILMTMLGLFIGTFEVMTLYRKRTDLATATRMAARQASEIWIETDTDLQDEIQTYVWDEMEKMGYSISWMDGSSDPDGDIKVKVFVEPVNLEKVGADLVFQTDGTASSCTYGQYIQVRLEMRWTFAIAPLDIFFVSFDPDNNTGVIKENALVRCWRGE